MTDNLNLDPDNVSRILMLTFGHMQPSGSYWAYIAVKPSRYDEFMRAINSNSYDMQRFVPDGFGEAIVSGEGTQPPTEVTKEVAAIFGLDIRDLFQSTGNPLEAINLGMAKLSENQGN